MSFVMYLILGYSYVNVLLHYFWDKILQVLLRVRIVCDSQDLYSFESNLMAGLTQDVADSTAKK